MNQIHAGRVLDLVPSAGGFVFALQQDSTEDGRTVVEYKTCDFTNRKLENITRNLFLLTKFGDCYEQFADNPQQFLSSLTAFYPNGDLLLADGNGTTKRIAPNGQCLLEGAMRYHGESPSALAIHDNAAWASYADHGVVVRYDLRTLRETFRYGGGANAALAGARGLWFEGDILFVCCTESGKIIQINRNNYHLEDHHLFTEPVYAFMKVQATEIVWLQSGIYKF